MIAYCTTCKGRAEHIKITLPQNLRDNPGPDSRFFLLDYASDDDLVPYLKSNHARDIASGKLVVYSLAENRPWHISHAKNMAAHLAIKEGADTLVTLDADNSAGVRFDDFITEKFKEPGIFLCPDFPLIHSLPHGPERPQRGYAGRLAIRTQDFIKAGGYDEVYDTWGSEDIDMIGRMIRLGRTMRHIDNRYLNVIPHNANIRFKEYPWARHNEDKRHIGTISKRQETVVNFGKFGLGTAFRNFGKEPIEVRQLPTRIFGIGLHKTATTSLHKAFQILGLDSFHWGEGEAPLIWHEMNSEGRSKTLERWYALSDLPIPLLYQKLDKAYPGSKFILTVREESKWLESVSRLWDRAYNPTRWVWDVYPFTNTIHRELYGRKDFDRETMLNRYRRHNAEVRTYFKDRPNDLLIMNMEAGDSWPELCSFLGTPAPAVSYPAEYATKRVTGDDWHRILHGVSKEEN
jgi:hypothetical protein